MCCVRNKKQYVPACYPLELRQGVPRRFTGIERQACPNSNACPRFLDPCYAPNMKSHVPSFGTSARRPAPVYRHRTPSVPKLERLPPVFGSMLCTEHEIACPVFWNFSKASRAGFPGIERQACPISCIRSSLSSAQHATVFCGENFCKSFPRAPFKICTKRRAGQSRCAAEKSRKHGRRQAAGGRQRARCAGHKKTTACGANAVCG